MSEDGDTLALLARHLIGAMEPLQRAVSSEDAFRALMLRLGWQTTSLPPEYINLGSAIAAAAQAAERLSDNPTPEEILELLRNAKNAYEDIQGISTTPAGVDAGVFLAEIGDRLFEILLSDYLASRLPAAFNLLLILNVIEIEYIAPTGLKAGHSRTHFKWEEIPKILSEPLLLPQRVYGWGTPNLRIERLLQHLGELFFALKFPVVIGRAEELLADGFHESDAGLDEDTRVLKVPFYYITIAGKNFEAAFSVLELKGSGGKLPGIIIQPQIPQEFPATFRLAPDIDLKVRAGTNLASQFGILIRPDEVLVRYPFQPGQALPAAGLGIGFDFHPSESVVLLGSPESTRLELQGAEVGLEVNHLSGSLEIILVADLHGLSLVVASGQGDSFIHNLIGDRDVQVDIPLGIQWSNTSGIHFRGGGGFEVELPSHIDLGIVTVNGIRVQARAPADGDPRVENTVGVNFTGQLGPLMVTVEDMGLKVTLTFVAGNAGPLSIDLGFNPPTGLGLVIEGSGFTGGGFMRYVEADQHYEGELELEYQDKITLKAIGLLTTRLPDGKAGYSLLIIITSEFTPVQLGLGFTLNGVGGLLGLNRTANAERLRSGLRDGTLNSVLFPENVIANASRILSDLNQVFPAEPGRFIFGPMARIGWGTPTLLTADLGLLIEIPDPIRVLILGVVKATLPDEKARLLELQVNFLGVIDFEGEWFSFDASLFNSKLLTYPLTGDMAVRLSWGAEPNFLLTVGGFHPAYDPPPLNLPSLHRMSMHLTSGNNPRITLDTYFAITSNTVQFGAKAELYAEAGGFNVYGYLSFDVLFQFNPFYFIASISAKLALRSGSSEIASIGLDFTLEGPTPWHAKGTAKLKICWFLTIKVRFDKTFGEERNTRLDDIPVLPLLQAALSDKGNWEAAPPGDRRILVSFKQIQTDGDQVLVYPFGILTVQQKVVPLKIPIQRFGSQRPADGDQFAIDSVLAGQPGDTEALATRDVSEMFAPGQFFELSDAQKLASKSFERYDSGVKLVDSESFDGDYAVQREVAYELFYVDEQRDLLRQAKPHRPDPLAFEHWATGGAIANSPLSHARTGKSALATGPVTIAQEAHAVVNASDLRPVADGTLVSSEAGARGVMQELIRANPALEGEILVVPDFEVNRS